MQVRNHPDSSTFDRGREKKQLGTGKTRARLGKRRIRRAHVLVDVIVQGYDAESVVAIHLIRRFTRQIGKSREIFEFRFGRLSVDSEYSAIVALQIVSADLGPAGTVTETHKLRPIRGPGHMPVVTGMFRLPSQPSGGFRQPAHTCDFGHDLSTLFAYLNFQLAGGRGLYRTKAQTGTVDPSVVRNSTHDLFVYSRDFHIELVVGSGSRLLVADVEERLAGEVPPQVLLEDLPPSDEEARR